VKAPLPPILILAATLMLAACTSKESYDARQAYVKAFDAEPPPGVEVVNGYSYFRVRWLVNHREGWMLQLRGPGVESLLHSRWPELRPVPGPVSDLVRHDRRLNWWNEHLDRAGLEVPGDGRYRVERHDLSGNWYLVFHSTR
jgi:hypothetical protein